MRILGMVVTAGADVFIIPALTVLFRIGLFIITFGVFHDHPELRSPGGGMAHFTSHLLQAGFFRIDLGADVFAFFIFTSRRLEATQLPVTGGVTPEALRIGGVIFFRVQLGFLLGLGALARLQEVKRLAVRRVHPGLVIGIMATAVTFDRAHVFGFLGNLLFLFGGVSLIRNADQKNG